ncbi:hypothetical protein [Sutterella wadsworthensis]|jgi:hypothetical protein|uniref:hypothetical protein n=1 Tax=Sutterella wadsworthensis TaxID=40545 RepID=UPI0013F65C1C|nr:hypothetical protein [Sutterella wadsworthensis]
MKTPFSKTDWVNNRNKALLRAGEGIIAARRSLDQLDEALQNTAIGVFPEVPAVVDVVHRLRGEIDSILIGFVESSAVPRKRDEAFHGGDS